MGIVLDAGYALLAVVTAPWWMRKARGGWAERFGRGESLAAAPGKRLLIHAVSVGEVNLIRPLVRRLAGEVDVVVSVGTDTGIARARSVFEGVCPVVRYPLDASWSVRRFLDRVRPDAVALAELEVWPQFVGACGRRGIPVAVVNGRLSERSFRGYRRGRWFIGRSFARLSLAAVQDEAYASRFRAMGVEAGRVRVVGSMKWDAAEVLDRVEGAEALAREMGIDAGRPLVVAGSTAPGEHALLDRAVPEGVQLVCAPRKPEWVDEAAAELGGAGVVRRSRPGEGDASRGRFLLDTIGELRAAYSLADVVVVGRSFGNLYGSDPMEPAALGKPVVIGPAAADFESIVSTMELAGAIVRSTPERLREDLAGLFADGERRRALGEAARRCVEENQGATERHAALLLGMMGAGETKGAA